MTALRKWLWPALVAAVAIGMSGVYLWSASIDPILPADEPLVALPAATLAGERLDLAWFGDRPWVILVWLPG